MKLVQDKNPAKIRALQERLNSILQCFKDYSWWLALKNPLLDMKEYTIELKYPIDLQNQMNCPKCGNPISTDNNYRCNKCRRQVYFKVKKTKK
jgi:hypothetical protein